MAPPSSSNLVSLMLDFHFLIVILCHFIPFHSIPSHHITSHHFVIGVKHALCNGLSSSSLALGLLPSCLMKQAIRTWPLIWVSWHRQTSQSWTTSRRLSCIGAALVWSSIARGAMFLTMALTYAAVWPKQVGVLAFLARWCYWIWDSYISSSILLPFMCYIDWFTELTLFGLHFSEWPSICTRRHCWL